MLQVAASDSADLCLTYTGSDPGSQDVENRTFQKLGIFFFDTQNRHFFSGICKIIGWIKVKLHYKGIKVTRGIKVTS